MSISDFMPPPSAHDTLEALLQVLIDPAAHKERLDALKAQAEESHTALLGAQDAQRQAEALHQEVAEKHADLKAFEQELNGRVAALDRRKQELDAQKVSLDAARKEHGRQIAELTTAAQAHRQREIDLDAREGAIAAKELHMNNLLDDVTATKAAAEELRADYERRIAKFKELAG